MGRDARYKQFEILSTKYYKIPLHQNSWQFRKAYILRNKPTHGVIPPHPQIPHHLMNVYILGPCRSDMPFHRLLSHSEIFGL